MGGSASALTPGWSRCGGRSGEVAAAQGEVHGYLSGVEQLPGLLQGADGLVESGVIRANR